MPINFEIIDNENVIFIESTSESFEPFNLCMDKFWNWILKKGYNHYCEDYYDPSEPDNHGQKVGTLTRENYYDLKYQLIKNDLVEYLIFKNILKRTL